MASDQSGRDAGTGTSAQTRAESGGATRQYVPRQAPRYEAEDVGARRRAAMSFTLFAAVLMMLSGAFNILEGVAGVIHNTFVVVMPNYVYTLSATG